MSTLQDDCNTIGSQMRALHALADASGNPALATAAATLHTSLHRGFRDHIRPEHPELDWDAIAGNNNAVAKATGPRAQAGVKHEDAQ